MDDKFKKWAIIFLIRAVDESAKQALTVIEQLKAAEINPAIEIIIWLHVTTENVPNDYPRGNKPSRYKTTNLFYEIKGNQLNCLGENAGLSIKKPEDITDFFKEQVINRFIVEKYILFTWGHGTDFAIFQYGVGMLTMTDLSNAITNAFGNRKIDVIVMFNCFQQFFDTGYELSCSADYLLAFETFMYFENDLDYSVILEKLSGEPAISTRAIASFIINSFAAKGDGNAEQKNDTAFFANDLSWYDDMARLIDEMAVIMINNSENSFHKIQAAREKCEYIRFASDKHALIDFKKFLLSLYDLAPQLFPEDLYGRMIYYFNKIVLEEKFIGEVYKQERGDKTISPSGFSIYFPATKDKYNTNYSNLFFTEESPYATKFTKMFRWSNFISEYIKCTKRNPVQGIS